MVTWGRMAEWGRGGGVDFGVVVNYDGWGFDSKGRTGCYKK